MKLTSSFSSLSVVMGRSLVSERKLKRERDDVDPIVEGVLGVGEVIIVIGCPDSSFGFFNDYTIKDNVLISDDVRLTSKE